MKNVCNIVLDLARWAYAMHHNLQQPPASLVQRSTSVQAWLFSLVDQKVSVLEAISIKKEVLS